MIQKWLDQELPPVMMFRSKQYLRFDTWRNSNLGSDRDVYMPKISFKYK